MQRTYPTRPRLVSAVLWLTAALLLDSCGGGGSNKDAAGGPTPPPEVPPVATLPFKALPARVSLEVRGQGALSTVGQRGAVTWVSSDPTIARVDASGGVTAVARGRATITASDRTSSSTTSVGVWDTAGSSPDATTGALIDAALAAGRIDAEQATVYRVYAQFADDRLPTEFDGAPDRDGTVSMRLLSEKLPTLSAATQALLLPFFMPPIYVDSWFGRQLGLSTEASARAKAQAVGAGRSGRMALSLNCHLGLLPGLEKRTTLSFTFWALPNPVTVAAMDSLAGSVEDIYARERALFQRSAKPDTDEPCNGGDGSTDVFIWPMGTKAAQTIAYPGRCQAVPSYIVVNANEVALMLASPGSDPTIGPRYLRSVLAHEVLHTIQFGMTRQAPCADYDWADEATAQWVMDELFPDDNFEDGIRKVDFAPRAGVFFADYVLGGHRKPLEQANGYSDYIFFQFIARKLGSQVVKRVFDAWEGNDSVQSIEVALVASGSSLREVWPEFARALWNDATDHVLDELNRMPHEGYVYGVKFAFDTLRAGQTLKTRTIALLGAGRAKFDLFEPLRSGAGYRIPPRSMAFERLEFTDSAVASVYVATTLIGSTSSALTLQALVKVGGRWSAVEDWSSESSKYFCRDKGDERIEELVLIVSNGDTAPASQPLVTSNALSVSTSNVGCWQWRGSASRSFVYDDGTGNSGDYLAAASDLVFENQGILFDRMLFGSNAGNASGQSVIRQASPRCETTITGPTSPVSGTDGMLTLRPDLEGTVFPLVDRSVGMLAGTTAITSTSVAVCPDLGINERRTFLNSWAWLLYPLATNPLSVSDDGRKIEGRVVETDASGGRTTHTLTLTAQRE